jgi:hypothetical protein
LRDNKRERKRKHSGESNSSSGNLGINTNPLKNPKKLGREEKRKGHKPHRQVLEEAGALLIDSVQVMRLMYKSFLPQPKC